jgi:hypothetical protein
VCGNVVTYNDLPLQFQIPVGYTCEGINQWNRVVAEINNGEFFTWFLNLEEVIGRTEPFDSVVSPDDKTISIKIVDGFTQIFEINDKKLLKESNLQNTKIHVIIDVSKKYGPFKERYGLTCKAYQIVFIEEECAFT